MTEDIDNLEPTLPHEFDMVVPEIKQIFENILKYRVDPAGEYHGITLEKLQKELSELTVNNIVRSEEHTSELQSH